MNEYIENFLSHCNIGDHLDLVLGEKSVTATAILRGNVGGRPTVTFIFDDYIDFGAFREVPELLEIDFDLLPEDLHNICVDFRLPTASEVFSAIPDDWNDMRDWGARRQGNQIPWFLDIEHRKCDNYCWLDTYLPSATAVEGAPCYAAITSDGYAGGDTEDTVNAIRPMFTLVVGRRIRR